MKRVEGIVVVSAGSAEYGRREAWYQIVDGVLVLRKDSGPDGLVGNSVAGALAGLTLAEAQEQAANAERLSDHDYCGCHACNFSVWIKEADEDPWNRDEQAWDTMRYSGGYDG